MRFTCDYILKLQFVQKVLPCDGLLLFNLIEAELVGSTVSISRSASQFEAVVELRGRQLGPGFAAVEGLHRG